MSSKPAYICPGIGYHCNMPLLHFLKEEVKAEGYTVIEIPYTGFEKNIKGSPEKMRQAFEHALAQTEEILAASRFMPADEDILFISKSIGTVVAAAYQRQRGIPAKNIFLTPVAETFQFVRAGSGIVFHGTADSWADTAVIKTECERLNLPLFLFDKANHSLETGAALTDIGALQRVVTCSAAYLRGNEFADTNKAK